MLSLNKILMLSLSLTAGISGLSADDQDDYKTFKDCLRIDDSALRVVCYDAFARGTVFSEKKVEEEQFKAFGEVSRPTLDTKETILVTIVEVRTNAEGMKRFWTESGQVWTQKGRGRLRHGKTPFEATIKKGEMKSFKLSPTDNKSSVGVSRVR
ncbi:hypothetical protein GCM10017044_16300 [Kordiimonas sediminis]|uniref:Uncharacterized protein n=1 Tax=Kordiimonas sediminis TaxID=1735581 RepID=A0A919ARM4_9PROT|nr:hypothetical protein [Kordiimonas sediminis]GHF22681.1 hypothetical protein GCM10017044_16300 [Kordiimonas sediminis]